MDVDVTERSDAGSPVSARLCRLMVHSLTTTSPPHSIRRSTHYNYIQPSLNVASECTCSLQSFPCYTYHYWLFHSLARTNADTSAHSKPSIFSLPVPPLSTPIFRKPSSSGLFKYPHPRICICHSTLLSPIPLPILNNSLHPTYLSLPSLSITKHRLAIHIHPRSSSLNVGSHLRLLHITRLTRTSQSYRSMQRSSLSPSVRISHSSPTPTPAPSASSPQPPMLAQSPLVGGWNDGYNAGPFLSALPKNFQEQRFHKRGSSGSSVTSAGPPSPLNHNTIYPHVATSDSTFPTHYDFDYSQTPHTAKSESTIMYPTNTGYGAVDMRRIHSQGVDDRGSYNLSAPQSVSTMSHNSPATPHTTFEPEYDEKAQHIFGEMNDVDEHLFDYLQLDSGYHPTAAYQQSLQDVFPDQQYQQQLSFNQAQQSMQRLNVTPHRQNMMADRLQAAQQDHLHPGASGMNPRQRSPFRQNSPYMAAPPPRQPPATLQKQRTSISPKELMLDEHDIDDNATPLFAPSQSQDMFATHRTPSNLSTFYTADPSMQIPQQYPFVSQGARQPMNSGLPDMAPEFPAHLISMESTGDEGPSEPSSQQSIKSRSQVQSTPQHHQHQQQQSQSVQRTLDTSSDSGTYSCTYHGCHLRFESPAKLQKHKREGHRQTSPTSSQQQSPNLALRNSQAGPHRCDRINPSTGKPCGSVFSRPYDLTRHEDTIHNGRKQKVRCHLCTEEKTFSRNDALTRHMRVVHPEVDWVGKQKRRSPK